MAPGLSYLVTMLSSLSGVKEPEVQFLVFQVISLLTAILYRTLLHPTKVNATTRHVVATMLGLYIGFYNFKWSNFHLLLQTTVAYVLMKFTNPRYMPQCVLIFSMVYLFIEQIRKAMSEATTSLDHQGCMMVTTQKVTGLAFSLQDGLSKNQSVNPKHKEFAVRRFPSIIEYYSYIFHFQAYLVGPFCFYKDYIEFVEGKYLVPRTIKDKHGKEVVICTEPGVTLKQCAMRQVSVSMATMLMVNQSGI
ncbi:membrane-bound glycerophospholipid O-acyltransferase 2-like [Glandiceps talaboti]